MIDRRGHRKLRLNNKKHFKPKPKLKQQAPEINIEAPPKEPTKPNPTCLKVSLPAEAYINPPVCSISKLQDRMK